METQLDLFIGSIQAFHPTLPDGRKQSKEEYYQAQYRQVQAESLGTNDSRGWRGSTDRGAKLDLCSVEREAESHDFYDEFNEASADSNHNPPPKE